MCEASCNSISQGQGVFTPDKQEGLSCILNQWLSIVNSIKAKDRAGKYDHRPSFSEVVRQPVLYVDMNAGCGWNHEANCPGSPMVFLEAKDRYKMSLYSHFIEQKRSHWEELCSKLNISRHFATRSGVLLTFPDPNHPYQIWNGDHNEVLPLIIRPKKTLGLLYHDPNSNPNFDLFRKLCSDQKFRFIDILIRIAGTSYKRQRIGVDNFGIKNNHPHLIGKYPLLKEQLQSINKREWIIRSINPGDPHQWTFLLGTNWTDYQAWKSKGFFNIKDREGAEILKKITYSKEELEGLEDDSE